MKKNAIIEAAKKHALSKERKRTAKKLRDIKINRKLKQKIEKLNDKALEASGQQVARRELNERIQQALHEYTLCYKASQGEGYSEHIDLELDDFRDCHSFASTASSSGSELFYFGSVDEEKEHETLFQMQTSTLKARESRNTRTIETQTDLSFLSY